MDEIRARYRFIALNEWKSHLWENKSIAVHYVTTNIVKRGSRKGERISSLPAWLARPIPFIASYDAISGSCIVETFCPQTRISTSTQFHHVLVGPFDDFPARNTRSAVEDYSQRKHLQQFCYLPLISADNFSSLSACRANT